MFVSHDATDALQRIGRAPDRPRQHPALSGAFKPPQGSTAGERFSLLYAQPPEAVSDSPRARHRIGSLLGDAVVDPHGASLAAQINRNLGVSMIGDGRHPSHWHQFIRDCRIADFLDTLTVVYRYLYWHFDERAATLWRDAVRKVFDEEHLGYEVDDAGGIHPRLDRTFQRNAASAVAGLQSERYLKVRELLDIGSAHLCSTPPNYKQAWRSTLSAVEVLFGLIFPYGRLTTDEVDRRLRPALERAYADDPAAQKTAQRMLAAFKEWIEASQRYRHQPGAATSPHPPADLAVLAISQGTSLLRWLAGFDEDRAR
jgi:hypothetical protein